MQSEFYTAKVAFTSKQNIKGLLTQLQDEEITYLAYECYIPNGRHYRLFSPLGKHLSQLEFKLASIKLKYRKD